MTSNTTWHWLQYLMYSTPIHWMLSWRIEIWINNSLSKRQNLQHCKSIMPRFSFKEMKNNDVKFTCSLGDTTHGRAVYNSYWARQRELVHTKYNNICNVQLLVVGRDPNDHTRPFFGCFLGANQSRKVLCLEKAGSAFVPKAFDFTYLLVTLSNSPSLPPTKLHLGLRISLSLSTKGPSGTTGGDVVA